MPNDLVPSTPAAALGSGVDAVVLPSQLVVARGPGTFELSWRWREQTTKQAFFGPVFLSFVLLQNGLRHAPLVTLGAYAAIAAVTYAAWAKNVVRVRVAQGAVTVTSGPVAVGSTELLAVDVDDFEARAPEAAYLGRKGTPRHRAHLDALAATDRWSVVARLRNGKSKRVVGPMLQRAQAEAIASLVREGMGAR